MSRQRSLLTVALFIPLLGCTGIMVAKAQPPGAPFDDGPLFDDGPRGDRPQGGPGGRGHGGPGGRDGRGGPGGFGGPDGRGGGPGGRRGPRSVKGRLEGTWRGINRLQREDKSLSKTQAVRLVALVKPWSSRAAMSDADAQKLVTSLETVLTTDQKSKVGPPGRGGPGGRGGRGGPPGGGGDFGPPPPRDGDNGPPGPPPDGGDFGPPPPRDGGPGGGRGPGGPGGWGGRAPLPASFNPFYAPTGRSDWKKLPSSTQQFLARRYRDNRATLESLSRFAKS